MLSIIQSIECRQ